MAGHDGWMWQGRQYHLWFGSGTKPRDGDAEPTNPLTLEQRINALPHVVLAGLTPSQRHHPAARFEGESANRLIRAMHAWVQGRNLSPTEFAARYFDARPDASGIAAFHDAAAAIAQATTSSAFRNATDALADAMVEVGLDRWERFPQGCLRTGGQAAAYRRFI